MEFLDFLNSLVTDNAWIVITVFAIYLVIKVIIEVQKETCRQLFEEKTKLEIEKLKRELYPKD